MHFLIQGLPATGKTSFIKQLVPYLKNARGFYTESIFSSSSERIGFKVVTLDKKEVIFAHRDINTPFTVGSYHVDIEAFDSLATRELEGAIHSDCDFVVIDEIGRMELISSRFQEVCSAAFEMKSVIGTIPVREIPYVAKIKERSDVCVINMDDINRDGAEKFRDFILMGTESVDVFTLRQLEKKARDIGLEERLLIENASSNLATVISSLFPRKKILVVAGRGNNGADTLSCARKLISRGHEVDISIVSEKPLNYEVNFQKEVLSNITSRIYFIKDKKEIDKLDHLIEEAEVILDGLVGIGIKGGLSDFLKKVIDKINTIKRRKKNIVSCDVPSGLNPDTGEIMGTCVDADVTVTFLAPKRGFFLKEGPSRCGRLFLVDIGISRCILEDIKTGI